MRIGPYEVTGEIGRGGMGAVYRARSPRGEDVAVKLIASADPAAFERFERERRLLATLGLEDGFVPLLDAGAEKGRPYLVMPFLAGGTLKERLKRGPLAVAEALALGRALAGALGRAHARGIVHRDLKPANVIYDERGRALVADLGLGRHFRRDLPGATASRSLTHAGAAAGTLGYMAPEQLDSAREANAASDVFSLGAILHECLAGELPFPGGSLAEYVTSLEGRAPSLAKARPDVPEPLARAIERALEREPEKRFPDGAAFERALAEAKPGRRRRRPLPLALGALHLLAAIAVFSYRALGTGEHASSPDVSDLIAKGDLAREKGDLAGALSLFTKATEEAPSLALAWAKTAEIDFKRNERDLAVKDASRAIELDPRCELAWFVRGTAHLFQKRIDPAIADLTRALALDPRHAMAHANRATARAEKGENDLALADYDRALELQPKGAWILCNRAGSKLAKGDLDGAIADFSRAVALDPRSLVAWYDRGTLRQRKGDLDGALEDFTRVLELDPKHVGALLSRGYLRGEKKDVDGALADYARAVELDPRNAQAWRERGVQRAKKGEATAAFADISKAIELDPKSAHAYMERGTLVADRDPAAALADVAKAVELDPKKSAAWRWLGLLRLKADDMKGALEAYDRSIELDPKDAMSFEGRAAARDALGDYEGTIADAERFHELLPERLVDPTLARAWVKRAITRSNAGDHAGALLDWTRAVEVGPRDPETWFGRGKEGAVAIQAGSVPDADAAPLVERSMADLSRAIGLAPSMSDAFYTRGLLCEVKGDKAGAIADYERFLELVPKDELAPSVREKLAALKGKP